MTPTVQRDPVILRCPRCEEMTTIYVAQRDAWVCRSCAWSDKKP